jgi:hypothetical protein
MPRFSLRYIPGYEGLYAVTKSGRVWSYPKQRNGQGHYGKWLKPAIISKDYYEVSLTKKIDDKATQRTFGVHRLVAITYIPNPYNKPQVNHIDLNPRNNHVSNLEWVTRSENMLHAASFGCMSRMGSMNGRYKYSDEQVKEVIKLYKNGNTITFISEKMFMPQSTVRAFCKGERELL